MAYKISWTKTARKQFDSIVNYLIKEWSEKVAGKFINRTNEVIELLMLYPEAGSIEIKEKRIRGFLISKHIRLFYRITKKEMLLLSFFDNRLDPDKKLKRYK